MYYNRHNKNESSGFFDGAYWCWCLAGNITGVHDIDISTSHTGSYEKYGCEFYQAMDDMHGDLSRVYRLHVEQTPSAPTCLPTKCRETHSEQADVNGGISL